MAAIMLSVTIQSAVVDSLVNVMLLFRVLWLVAWLTSYYVINQSAVVGSLVNVGRPAVSVCQTEAELLLRISEYCRHSE